LRKVKKKMARKNFKKQAITSYTLKTGDASPINILINGNAKQGDDRDFKFVINARTSAGATVNVTDAVYDNTTGATGGYLAVSLASDAVGTTIVVDGVFDYEDKFVYSDTTFL
jgi:hypothetical protein